MEKNLIEKYYELQDGLKSLITEINILHTENVRLSKENIELRHEVTMWRLYVDTRREEEEGQGGLPELSNGRAIGQEALELYDALPDSFSFSTLFELSDVLDIDVETVKKYLQIFLKEKMLRQRRARIEKTGHRPPWNPESGQERSDFLDECNAN